ncbi:hypothetical protein HRbin04_01062 [archaeon HR04]|nr:hypothetical protein HRbin04_01062 [archaeon HR04]
MHEIKDEDVYTYWSIRKEYERLARIERLAKLLLLLPFASTLLILTMVFLLLR